MATYTENYNLEKPAQSDLYNIDVFNENADKIDEALGGKAENQSLAPIESSATASRNYSIGQQFVYNGLLYEATSAIASGGTITPGSNCARTTVAEELSALNDSLANFISGLRGLKYKQVDSNSATALKLTTSRESGKQVWFIFGSFNNTPGIVMCNIYRTSTSNPWGTGVATKIAGSSVTSHTCTISNNVLTVPVDAWGVYCILSSEDFNAST